jgi:hypothetical protein
MDSVGKISSVMGVFFLGCGALFALLMAGGTAGGKAAAGRRHSGRVGAVHALAAGSRSP